ncbi:MAG: hypothetical protein IPK62_17290 [Bacteroidetes bacterium]|nr:hypothetical protein [Bacteroidota bacterium]
MAAALRLLEKTDRTVHRVDALNYLFDQAFEQGQLIVAGKYLQQAEQIARELGYRVGLSQTCIYKAMLEDARGDKPAALAALQEAASIARELGDDRNPSVALGNLGNVQRTGLSARRRSFLPGIRPFGPAHRQCLCPGPCLVRRGPGATSPGQTP